jgi:hypothetical protein
LIPVVEKVRYTVLKKFNQIEIRNYPRLLIALVKGHNENAAFGLLFNYISGNNKIQKKIRMTAPVINAEKIEMTAPVISQDDYMAFILPSEYQMNNVPIPLDPQVEIRDQPERKLAVIRFSGYTNANKISKFKEKLFMELKSNQVKIIDNPLLMRYNSPFAPPFFRRNEIGVEIEDE